MKRVRIASTEFGRMRSPNVWVEIQEHLMRGDEVEITHYRRPVALIVPHPDRMAAA